MGGVTVQIGSRRRGGEEIGRTDTSAVPSATVGAQGVATATTPGENAIGIITGTTTTVMSVATGVIDEHGQPVASRAVRISTITFVRTESTVLSRLVSSSSLNSRSFGFRYSQVILPNPPRSGARGLSCGGSRHR
jgi:hypothetical protein